MELSCSSALPPFLNKRPAKYKTSVMQGCTIPSSFTPDFTTFAVPEINRGKQIYLHKKQKSTFYCDDDQRRHPQTLS
jgi:hypothetical protein